LKRLLLVSRRRQNKRRSELLWEFNVDVELLAKKVRSVDLAHQHLNAIRIVCHSQMI
jgi:hypothetical protein